MGTGKTKEGKKEVREGRAGEDKGEDKEGGGEYRGNRKGLRLISYIDHIDTIDQWRILVFREEGPNSFKRN